jgi:hypothetical protein
MSRDSDTCLPPASIRVLSCLSDVKIRTPADADPLTCGEHGLDQ